MYTYAVVYIYIQIHHIKLRLFVLSYKVIILNLKTNLTQSKKIAVLYY